MPRHVRAPAGDDLQRVRLLLDTGPELIGLGRPDPPSEGLWLYQPEGSGWITVADLPGDRFLLEAGVLNAIAKAIGGASVSTRVFDSDFAAVTRLERGRARGSIEFPLEAGATDAALAKWADLLPEGATLDELEAASTGRRALAEDHVVEFLEILGIDATAAVDLFKDRNGAVRLASWARPSATQPPPAASPVPAARAVVQQPARPDVSPEDLPLGLADHPNSRRHAAGFITPSFLVACFVLDPERTTSEHLVPVLEGFLTTPELLDPDDPVSIVSLGQRTGLGMKMVRAKEIGAARRWDRINGIVDRVADLHLSEYVRPVEVDLLRDSGNWRPRGVQIIEPLVLILTAGIDRASPAAIALAAEHLIVSGDRLLSDGLLEQGFTDRWAQGGVFARHAYTAASKWNAFNRAGPWADSLKWARRYLYAVAARTWVGGQLADRVRQHLDDIGDLASTVGGGLRIDAPLGTDRRRVERGLAQFVPGMSEIDAELLLVES